MTSAFGAEDGWGSAFAKAPADKLSGDRTRERGCQACCRRRPPREAVRGRS
jgi:hypothetical protein